MSASGPSLEGFDEGMRRIVNDTSDAIRVHPLAILGAVVFTLAVGAILAITLFEVVAAAIGLPIWALILLWMLIGIATMTLGVSNSDW